MRLSPPIKPADKGSHADAAPKAPPLRSSRLTSLWSLYVLTLRQHLHGKRWMVMLGLCLLIVGLVTLVRFTAVGVAPRMSEFVFAFLFLPQAALPLLALIYASGIVRDEQEEQTMTYLLIRPIPKFALYLLKLLASLTTTVVLSTALTIMTYVVVYVGVRTGDESIPQRCLHAVAVHALAVAAYCCLFSFISLFTKHALIVGVLYSAVIEGLLANMPFSVRLVTVIYYTRLVAYRTMSFVAPRPGSIETHDLADDAWQLDARHDPLLSLHPDMNTCLTVLIGGSLACAILGAIVFSQREFHVKTPEKAE